MDEFLDTVLGELEGKPLSAQFSELAKNDSLGYPLYVRGVVMTKAYFDKLHSRIAFTGAREAAREAAAEKPALSYDPSSDAYHFGKWTFTGKELVKACSSAPPARPDFYSPFTFDLGKPPRATVAKVKSPQWWEDGGWD